MKESTKVLWEEAHRLNRKYDACYGIFRYHLKKGEKYKKLSAEAKALEEQYHKTKHELRDFVKSNRPKELEELKIKRNEAWKIAQDQNKKDWKEREKKEEGKCIYQDNI